MIPDTSGQDTVLASHAASARPKRLVWVLAAAIGAALIVLLLSRWLGSERSVDISRLRIAEVTRGTLVRDASVNGRVVAAISPTLYAPAASTVTLKIHAGDKVAKGDLLAVLDSPELSNALAREQSTLAQLESQVARQRILAEKARLLARRDADEAEVTRLGAERILQRTEGGYKAGAIAEVDFLRAQDALKSAQIRAKQAGQASQLEIKDVALETSTRVNELERQRLIVADAQRRVDELQVRSPVNGVVGTLSVADRSVVAGNTALMTVVDLSQLEVELEIPESYADDLGLGMSAEVNIGAIKAMGKLSALSPEVVRNQVLARVRFDGKQPAGLRQNQRLSARVLIEEKPNVLMLPRGSFVENEGGRAAYVMDGGVAVRRPIQLGATSVSAVEILSGLQPGDKVVIAGTDAFENAERISVND
ncbi:MAG: efflux RND transporter periplasmic adaptor subunit [Arenimonas sp.]